MYNTNVYRVDIAQNSAFCLKLEDLRWQPSRLTAGSLHPVQYIESVVKLGAVITDY